MPLLYMIGEKHHNLDLVLQGRDVLAGPDGHRHLDELQPSPSTRAATARVEPILKGYPGSVQRGHHHEVRCSKNGSFILEVVAGATDSSAGQDVTSLKNKVEVAECFTDHVASSGIDYLPPNPPAIDDLAHSSVDDTGATTNVDLQCLDVELDINAFLLIGTTFDLTPGADRVPEYLGTDVNDTYNAFVEMTNFLPLQTLNNEDYLDGAGGYDILTRCCGWTWCRRVCSISKSCGSRRLPISRSSTTSTSICCMPTPCR